MHKEEAGMLFECLGNPNRVKIVKLLYHTSFLTLVELEIFILFICSPSFHNHHTFFTQHFLFPPLLQLDM